MANLDEMISTLRQLNQVVPKPARLPTAEEVRTFEKQAGVAFHPDLRRYLLEASDVAFSVLEPITISNSEDHTHFLQVLECARDHGVPLDLIPICEDNADFYCMRSSGEIVFWNHNGPTDESWNSIADWIAQVWIGEAEEHLK